MLLQVLQDLGWGPLPRGFMVPPSRASHFPLGTTWARCRPLVPWPAQCHLSGVGLPLARQPQVGGSLAVVPASRPLTHLCRGGQRTPTASPRSRFTPGSSLPESEGAVERLRGCFPWADGGSDPPWTGGGGLGGQLGGWRGREQPLAPSGFSLRCLPMGSLSLISPPPRVSHATQQH